MKNNNQARPDHNGGASQNQQFEFASSRRCLRAARSLRFIAKAIEEVGGRLDELDPDLALNYHAVVEFFRASILIAPLRSDARRPWDPSGILKVTQKILTAIKADANKALAAKARARAKVKIPRLAEPIIRIPLPRWDADGPFMN